MTKSSSLIATLAPEVEPFDPDWSRQTLARIVSCRPTAPQRRRGRQVAVAGLAAAVLTVGTATAVAVGGPDDVIKGLLIRFSEQPNTSVNGLGEIGDPELVAQFRTPGGLFAFWVAGSSSGGVCFAMSDGRWDGQGSPTEDQLSYGCGGEIYTGPDSPPAEVTRADQLGGFFKDDDGPLVYGVSAYPGAVAVRVQAPGVDRTLPVRADSHGYGAALPEAEHAAAVTLTFLDANGDVLGTKRSVAPVG